MLPQRLLINIFVDSLVLIALVMAAGPQMAGLATKRKLKIAFVPSHSWGKNMIGQDIFVINRSPLNKSHIIWKDGQKEKIVELYIQGTSINQIGKLFGGLHYNTIKKILQERGIRLRTRSESHYSDGRNVDIFKIIDSEEKAYWLGFLSADGCVYKGSIKINLQARDKNHLEKFKKFVGVKNIDVRIYIENGREYADFSFGCIPMVENLKQYGVVENKSLKLQPPIGLIPEEFYLDWVRGYIDGDGGISYSKKNNRWQSYVNSTKEVCQWIVEILELNTKPFRQKHYGVYDNVWRIHFNGRINVYKAWNKMFHNNKATIYLDRKYEMYKKLCSSFN